MSPTPSDWQLNDAEQHFGAVVHEALHAGPQTVTRHGQPVVVVVAADTWRRLSPAAAGLKALLRMAPLDGLDLARDAGDRPEVDLP